MTTRHEGHGNLAKQFLKVASMAGMMKLSHLHSQQAYSSGENLSPRSVLEQTSLSGLAIAIDLEEKEKLIHTQENVIVGRVFWKQNIQQNASMGRSVYRERMDDNMNQEERETVGLRVVASLHQMNSQEVKGHENLIMGRSVSRERMREMVQMTYGGRERLSDNSASERKEDVLCTSRMKGSLSSSPSFPNVDKLLPKSLPEREESRGWLHLHGHEAQSFPTCSSSMENSIFYCASSPPNTNRNVIDNDDDDHTCSPVEDFLQLCFFCKCHLRAGKDIFMYRGDQAFCSAECRYQQIMNDECMGSSAP